MEYKQQLHQEKLQRLQNEFQKSWSEEQEVSPHLISHSLSQISLIFTIVANIHVYLHTGTLQLKPCNDLGLNLHIYGHHSSNIHLI